MHLFLLGAGHVGLVTAVGFARLGHRVTVADINEERIAGLRAGRAPMFEPGMEDGLAEEAARLSFTTDTRPPADARFRFVAVGTPPGPDGALSMAQVLRAVRDLLAVSGPNDAIVVRSTLPLNGPGDLETLRAASPGEGAIVTNPEFMREGSALKDFAEPGRIVTGWLAQRDQAAAQAVLDLYQGIDAPTLCADARSVAMVKLASNGYLALKIAYANELARLAEAYGANASIVSDGMGMDPRIGRSFLDAGPGFGGSCLPEQAIAISELAKGASVPAPVIDAVAMANEIHQGAIVRRLAELLGRDSLRGTRIALLGLAFKARTDDVRESPAIAIAGLLRGAGASVVATDPRAIEAAKRVDPDLDTRATPAEVADGADAVVVVTEWPEYRDLDWPALARAMRGDLVYDLRALVDRAAVEAAGLRAVVLGRP
jgi:UDPglucose 6-dehydrogenase